MLKSFAKQTYRGKPVSTKKTSGFGYVFGGIILIGAGCLGWFFLNFMLSLRPQMITIQSKYMGTTLTVKCSYPQDKKAFLEQEILKQMEEADHLVSSARYQSELAKFNASTYILPQKISKELFSLFVLCEELYRKTGGLWDGAGKMSMPVTQDIQIKWQGGFNRIVLTSPAYVQKTDPLLTLNLSSIAQGFVIDHIADVLKRKGIKKYSIVLGDQVRVWGMPMTIQKGSLSFLLQNQALSAGQGLLVVADSATAAQGLAAVFKTISSQDAGRIAASFTQVQVVYWNTPLK